MRGPRHRARVVAGVEVDTAPLDRRRARVRGRRHVRGVLAHRRAGRSARCRPATRRASIGRSPRRARPSRAGHRSGRIGGARSSTGSPRRSSTARTRSSAVETADNGSLLVGEPEARRRSGRAQHRVLLRARPQLRVRADRAGRVADNHVRHEPAGVAALVTPWNAPLMLSTWKIGPALAAGNTVVLKPPEWAPLSCSLLARDRGERGRPAGRVQRRARDRRRRGPGARRSTPASIASASPARSRRAAIVARAAAANLTPVSLELGGKSPFVVFADADLDEAAATVVAQFHNAGQVCLAGTRILVEASIEPSFRRRVLEGAPRPRSSATRGSAASASGR